MFQACNESKEHSAARCEFFAQNCASRRALSRNTRSRKTLAHGRRESQESKYATDKTSVCRACDCCPPRHHKSRPGTEWWWRRRWCGRRFGGRKLRRSGIGFDRRRKLGQHGHDAWQPQPQRIESQRDQFEHVQPQFPDSGEQFQPERTVQFAEREQSDESGRFDKPRYKPGHAWQHANEPRHRGPDRAERTAVRDVGDRQRDARLVRHAVVEQSDRRHQPDLAAVVRYWIEFDAQQFVQSERFEHDGFRCRQRHRRSRRLLTPTEQQAQSNGAPAQARRSRIQRREVRNSAVPELRPGVKTPLTAPYEG